jgi:glycosyltransferase 2 family protein
MRHKRSPVRRVIESMLGYAVGGACLYWLFHDLPLGRLVQTVAGIHWWRLGPCVALVLAAYLCVAWEWQLLLRPAGTLSFRRAAQAVFAGRFANDVLPMQLGYLVRAVLASRWMGVRLAAAFPSLIVERLWDGLWLALGIGCVSFVVPFPPDLIDARNIFGATVLGGTLAVAVVVALRRRMNAGTAAAAPVTRSGVQGRVRFFFGCLAGGIGDIARSRLLPAVIGLALLKLVIQALAFLGLIWAFGFDLPLGTALAVFLAGYLGMCIPSTPASTGLFQVFVVAALGFFGVAKPAAAGFSLVSFAALTIPPALTGFFALARSGLTLRQVRRESSI